MKLYFVRHAAAIARGGQVVEEHRYLTLHGRESFRLTAKKMAKRGGMPDAIITSPLVRAVQTAEILSEALAFEGKLVVSPEWPRDLMWPNSTEFLLPSKKRIR